MSKITIIILIFISILIVLNKKVVSYYYTKKFSNWVERPIKFKKLNFNYSGYAKIEGIEILNSGKNYHKNVFRAEKIEIYFDMSSIFSDLIVIKNLDIYNPEFFLDINIKENKQNIDNKKSYEDNIGLAKKMNENLPDKVWPKKNKDINFLIERATLFDSIGYIRLSEIPYSSMVRLSQMKFSSFGNDKNHRHYKDVLKSILFDMYARTNDVKLKKLLKRIYKF
tara:strand:- start:93 stop:764 length:672 start_codon:yes stop_codon:yes gene_type:complete